MADTVLVKTFFLYLAISIFLYAGGVRFTDAVGTTFDTLVGSSNETSTPLTVGVRYQVGSAVQATSPDVDETSTSDTGFSLIDSIRAVRNFINFIADLLFAIPGLFFYFPGIIQLMVGVPLTFATFFGLIYFVRAGT